MAQISVLLPVYNVAAYVAEALGSVQQQTFTDLEIVVVDDSSTDETLRIVENLARGDRRIKVVRTPRNQGLSAALNFGLSFCQAPLVARMDGDDVALPTRLEKQFRFLEEHPDVALVGCATKAIDQLGHEIPGLGVSRKPVSQEAVTKTMLLAAPCSHIWLARREVYDALSGYRAFEYAEDYDFLLRAIETGFRVSNLPEPLMLIRKRIGNLSSNLSQRKAHNYIVRLCRERRKDGQDSFSQEGYKRAIKSDRVETFAYRLSMKCVEKAVRSSNRALRYVFSALSAMLSPWQARYFVDRVLFKLVMCAHAEAEARAGFERA